MGGARARALFSISFSHEIGFCLRRAISLVPRPRPPGEGKGLVTIARFLVCAESAVLFSRQPIRLLGLKISCDIKRS